MTSPNSGKGYTGTQTPQTAGADFNAHTFLVWSILARVRTMQICKVMGVTNAGGIEAVGFVDLLPLVNQVDGNGNAVPHGTIYRCPYFRLQGGDNAVIIDPVVGDIGWAGFADRDISKVVATKAQANPGSGRKFDMADAVYFGGIINGTPKQYMAFSSNGIDILSPTRISLTAPVIVSNASSTFTVNSPQSQFSGAVIVQGLLSWLAGMTGSVVSGVASVITGAVQFVGTITSNGKSIDSTHTHGGVQEGGDITDPPN
ncbi:oxidoreductase [Robbsia sp. KACC 23696]|uniref:oxidoreductase n=1 Tax=Robbsia sp. KACC 23696 TaxID=3149231 RepID=UPI00325AFA2A